MAIGHAVEKIQAVNKMVIGITSMHLLTKHGRSIVQERLTDGFCDGGQSP